MQRDYVTEFANHISSMMANIVSTQRPQIESVAAQMADCIASGHNIFVFGPGHAGIVTEDFFYRAGGLVVVNPLFNPCLASSANPITLSTATELLPGMATVIIDQSPLQSGDLLLIHSVAARNPIVVEMALHAQDRGIQLAAILNANFAGNVTSRDASGKLLQDIVPQSHIIDNCGELGDACMQLDGLEQKVASTSSISGTFIVACIVLAVCSNLQQRGIDPPVFWSANVDGGAAKNDQLLQQCRKHVFYA